MGAISFKRQRRVCEGERENRTWERDKGLRPLSGGALCDSPGGCEPSVQPILHPTPPPTACETGFPAHGNPPFLFRPTLSSPQESANPYPTPLGSSRAKRAPNLILKTRGAAPLSPAREGRGGTHFALNKGQGAPQFTSCHSTRRPPLLPKEQSHPILP